MKPRYMIHISVREVNEDRVWTDTYAEYATEYAIEDEQEADYIASTYARFANARMKERADHSPVTLVEDDPTYIGSTTWKRWKVDLHLGDDDE